MTEFLFLRPSIFKLERGDAEGGRADAARAVALEQASADAREHLEPSLGADHPDTRAARELDLAAVPAR